MKKILLVGEYCVDQYVIGSSERLSPEAPVPVFVPKREKEMPGMAGNVFENLMKLKTDDIHIDKLFYHTGYKTRYVDEGSGYQMFRIDKNKDIVWTETDFDIDLSKYDIIIISDYNKGYINDEIIKKICKHPLVLVDTKKKDLRPFGNSIIKINEKETKELLYRHSGDLISTLGKRGCSYKETIYPTRKVDVIDVTGAGDSFLAGLAINYLQEGDIEKAIQYANVVSSIAVSYHGTYSVSKEEVEEILNVK